MPTIAKNNDVITVIVIFAVEPERQQELVDTIKEPKYKPLNEYWQGLAENEFHLYEVAFTIPAD